MSVKKKNPKCVTIGECVARHEGIGRQLKELTETCDKINLALAGEDLQGGLVKAVADLKAQLKAGSTFIDWLKPIIIAVISSGLTAYVLTRL